MHTLVETMLMYSNSKVKVKVRLLVSYIGIAESEKYFGTVKQ